MKFIIERIKSSQIQIEFFLQIQLQYNYPYKLNFTFHTIRVQHSHSIEKHNSKTKSESNKLSVSRNEHTRMHKKATFLLIKSFVEQCNPDLQLSETMMRIIFEI